MSRDDEGQAQLADLRSRSLRGGVAVMVAQGCKLVLVTVSTIFLARLLDPRDFGLYGMVTPLTGFVSMFQNFGLSVATMQRKEISNEQISALFWINLVASAFLSGLVAALSPLISRFYGEPALTAITAVAASNLLLTGVAVQHLALLKRNMRFVAVATVDLMSVGIGIGASVAMALLGKGYWALVAMPLVTALVSSCCCWYLAHWTPSRPCGGAPVRELVSFGANLTGFSVLNFCARNMDNVLIGRAWGAAQLGIYTRAYGLLLLPMRQITSPLAAVVLPSLSRLQGQPDAYRKYYLKMLGLLASITVPSVVFIFLFADEVVFLLLGPKWNDCATLFRCLGGAALVVPLSCTGDWLYITRGRTRQLFQWGAVGVSAVLLGFLIGLPFGARGVALSYSIVSVAWFWPNMALASRGTSVRMFDVLGALVWPVFASAIAGGGAFCVRTYLSAWSLQSYTAASGVTMVAVYCALIATYVFRVTGLKWSARRPGEVTT